MSTIVVEAMLIEKGRGYRVQEIESECICTLSNFVARLP